MASSKGKSRGQSAKKRVTRRVSHPDTCCRLKLARRKRANTPYQRRSYNSVSIPQLVYELLTLDKSSKGLRVTKISRKSEKANRCSSQECLGTRHRRMWDSHEQQRLSYQAVDHSDGSESAQVPEYTTESRPTSIDSLTEVTDAANSSAPSSANSSVSSVSMEPIKLANSLNSAKALFRKRSLIQLINSYIKAGIEEGKRHAKEYIRKALSFGVRSGYLIPANRRGNVLHVCPILNTQSWGERSTDIESRRRRRIARRGKMHLTTIADRKAMRRGIPRDRSSHNVDNERIASKRRYKLPVAQSPVRSLSTRESTPGKSSGKALHERNKPKAKKSGKINTIINNKREQLRKRDNNKNVIKLVKRRRTSSSMKRAEYNHDEPVKESYKDVISGKDRDQYKSNEDNYRAERQKSTSSQEDELRIEKRMAEANIANVRINCDGIENKNVDGDNDDKMLEKSNAEHDMNDRTSTEMEH